MKGDSVCFSSKSDHWQTPQSLFDKLDLEFHFHCDAAADETNTKCGMFLSDPLNNPWYPDVYFMNPPYSKLGKFIKKAYEESLKGSTVVCLIPSRTDTQYWHSYVMQASEIRFIKGRVKFSGSKNSAPFPSCVILFENVRLFAGWYPKVSTLELK